MIDLELNKLDNGEFYDQVTGNTYLMPMDDKIKYYNLLSCVIIPNVSAYKIVDIRFRQKGDMIYFNGLAGILHLKGGFSIKGFIELTRGYIGLSYDIHNDNNYQFIGYFFDNSEKKER